MDCIHQQSRDDNIHGLAVPDLCVDPAIGCKDPSESPNALFTLEAGILG